MRKKFIWITVIFLSIIIALVMLYNSFNKHKSYEYFPVNSRVIIKFDNYKDLIKINSFFWNEFDLEKIKNNFFLRKFPYKDFYLVVDAENYIYIFSDFSFLTGYLDKYGQVNENIFCYTNNDEFELKKTNYNENNIKNLINKDKDISFYLNLQNKRIFPFIENKAIYGDIVSIPENNLISLNYSYDYDYKNIHKVERKIELSRIPDRFDMFVNINMKNFENHYADLRKLFKNSVLFERFFKFKSVIYKKTGIDIENDLLGLVDSEIVVGIKNKSDYFAAVDGVDKDQIERIEFQVSNKFPLRFETEIYKNNKYRTINLEGVVGFLASGLFKKEFEKMKKPYYFIKNKNLYLFDSLGFLRNYYDNIDKYNLEKDDNYRMYHRYSKHRDGNIEFYLNERYLNELYKENLFGKYFKNYYGKIDFDKKSIKGLLVLKAKTNMEG